MVLGRMLDVGALERLELPASLGVFATSSLGCVLAEVSWGVAVGEAAVLASPHALSAA